MNNPGLSCVFDAIDSANAQDPRQVEVEGKLYSMEHLYAIRMTGQQQRFIADASEELQIACRAQHLQRWKIPRADYPMDRAGYRRWRSDLGRFHAERTAQLMRECGYEEASCQRVMQILTKTNLKRDQETQALEDVACLVFIEHYLAEFAARHERGKLLGIIRKTWAKMSTRGHEAALQIQLDPDMAALVQEALAG